jgi:anti-sigma B factor antagonist
MDSGELRVTAEDRDGVCVLAVSGELDVITSADFTLRATRTVREATGPVLVDLSGLTFTDASGARALAAVIGAIPAWRLVAVWSGHPPVRRVLALLGIDLEQAGRPAETAAERQIGTLAALVRVTRSRSREAVTLAEEVMARLAVTSATTAALRADLVEQRRRYDLRRQRARQLGHGENHRLEGAGAGGQ